MEITSSRTHTASLARTRFPGEDYPPTSDIYALEDYKHVWNQDTFGESGGSGWSSFRLCLVVAIFRSEAMRCQEGLRAERARAQYGSPLGNPLS